MVDSRKRIAGAFLIGGTLVVGAFVLSLQKQAQAQVGAVIVADAERSHIGIEDTNGDGVPNWRESLQKTDPIVLPQASSTYERPTTITGRFALDFIENVYRSKMYGAFGDSQEELLAESVEKLEHASQDVLFTKDDLHIADVDDTSLLRAYGNHIASIALSSKGGEENEVIILQDALHYQKPERLNDLDPIAASYVQIVKQMLELPTPKNYTNEHLDLLNAYDALREDVRSMQRVYEDPLFTFVRMKRYEEDVYGMVFALRQLFDALEKKGGVVWQEGDTVLELKTMIENI